MLDGEVKRRLADFFEPSELVEYLSEGCGVTIEEVVEAFEEVIEEHLDDIEELMDVKH
jgi:hypothetical protein